MFLYIPGKKGKKFKNKDIKVYSLANNEQWIETVNAWSHENSLGLIALTEQDKTWVQDHKNEYYILVYGEGKLAQPIGMFALLDMPLSSELKKKGTNNESANTIKELNCVYLSKSVRGLGLFSILMEKAKKIAKNELRASIVFLETLDPSLNRLYEKHGAKILCNSRYPKDPKESNSTTVLSITL